MEEKNRGCLEDKFAVTKKKEANSLAKYDGEGSIIRLGGTIKWGLLKGVKLSSRGVFFGQLRGKGGGRIFRDTLTLKKESTANVRTEETSRQRETHYEIHFNVITFSKQLGAAGREVKIHQEKRSSCQAFGEARSRETELEANCHTTGRRLDEERNAKDVLK